VFAEEQSDFVFFSGLQRSGQSATRAGCPILGGRQTLEHCLDDVRVSAVESKRQKILPVGARLFRVKIHRARQEELKHVELTVHCCRHYRCETIFVGKINRRSCIEEPARCVPILL
jgi:hypothetical protein